MKRAVAVPPIKTIAEYDLPDATAEYIAATLTESAHRVPLVALGESEAVGGIERHDVALDAVRVGPDADQYDWLAAAIERAAVMTRL
ncbi:hypothetical protein [Halovenus salina]|uniref:hypothetical protein n=1 Tax=Halovenus salina TaxID=1510225 RepID=UPI002260D45D|nr:hypothetical protein [Halovenus salina]